MRRVPVAVWQRDVKLEYGGNGKKMKKMASRIPTYLCSFDVQQAITSTR